MIKHSVEPRETIILEAGRGQQKYWSDVLRHHDLFFMLMRRDITVRYKQTAIGIAWAVLRPFITMLVFTFVFGHIAKLSSEGVPYSLVVFSAMVPWFFFSSAVGESSASLVANASLLSKVYFPRMLMPASAVGVAAVDCIISMMLLVLMMFFFEIAPTWRLLVLPLFLLIALASALGIGLLFGTLNVRYRDFQFVVPFLLQFGLYISPVGFMSTVVPEKWALVYGLNPMVGVIDGFRWAIMGGQFRLNWGVLFIGLSMSVLLLASGLLTFRRFERSIADVI